MDNWDLIYLGCFSSFYCQSFLALRYVQCDALEINPAFNFNLYQFKWQHADPGKLRFSAWFNHTLLGISKIAESLWL